MAETRQDNIIDLTISHFQPYYNEKITVDEASEIVSNFTGFARLLLKLEEKRQLAQKIRSKNYDTK